MTVIHTGDLQIGGGTLYINGTNIGAFTDSRFSFIRTLEWKKKKIGEVIKRKLMVTGQSVSFSCLLQELRKETFDLTIGNFLTTTLPSEEFEPERFTVKLVLDKTIGEGETGETSPIEITINNAYLDNLNMDITEDNWNAFPFAVKADLWDTDALEELEDDAPGVVNYSRFVRPYVSVRHTIEGETIFTHFYDRPVVQINQRMSSDEAVALGNSMGGMITVTPPKGGSVTGVCTSFSSQVYDDEKQLSEVSYTVEGEAI
mgnify:CR=1 FL=1